MDTSEKEKIRVQALAEYKAKKNRQEGVKATQEDMSMNFDMNDSKSKWQITKLIVD